MILTRNQRKMIHYIYFYGGEVRCLWKLANELDMNYKGAYQNLQVMHAMGIITVRRSGRQLVISGHKIEPIAEILSRISYSNSECDE